MVILVSMTSCKNVENVESKVDIDYSETGYNFIEEEIIEVNYE